MSGDRGVPIHKVSKGTRYHGALLPGRRVRVGDRFYSTPSAAAIDITGQNANGWRWWKYFDAAGIQRLIEGLR